MSNVARSTPFSADEPPRDRGRWVNHGTVRSVYESRWVTLSIDEVERPDGSRVHHEVVRGPDAAGLAVVDPARGFLMIWRHRHLPDAWGWEIPGGLVDPGESEEEAARRECLEETGWEATGAVDLLTRHHPACGLIGQTFSAFLATDAEHRGDPTDTNEAALVAWRTPLEVAADLRAGRIPDAFTQLAVTLALARVAPTWWSGVPTEQKNRE